MSTLSVRSSAQKNFKSVSVKAIIKARELHNVSPGLKVALAFYQIEIKY